RIVDRYLEHARVFIFHNNGQPEYYMGSADWMNRNLHSRIEVCFPVYDETLCKELQHIIQLQLADNVKAVLLKSDTITGAAINEKIITEGYTLLSAQEAIYSYVKELKG
ncbi:MAG: polyphosphate kinase 1, partial [Chitinophagaceae bacterium]|nr:polyphosphate kinase 1 [Chitinophagaceae bacterium]